MGRELQSPVFVVTSGTVMHGAQAADCAKVFETFKGVHMQLIQSNLSSEQEAKLKEEFGG